MCAVFVVLCVGAFGLYVGLTGHVPENSSISASGLTGQNAGSLFAVGLLSGMVMYVALCGIRYRPFLCFVWVW